VDIILLYRHDNLKTFHCLSPTLLSASLRRHTVHVSCTIRKLLVMSSGFKRRADPLVVTCLEAQQLKNVSTYFLLPHPFQIIIPSHPISRHLQSEAPKQSFRKIRRQMKLSGQPQAPAALIPVKETPFLIGRENG
jgi:hypothetical protein